jgi:FKBP-type peptidyl-prolyl cis-trans isomerase
MIHKLIPGAVALGLIAHSAAQPAAGETAAPAAQEAPAAQPAADPAAVRTDSSYALGYRTGGGFAQQFGKFGVGAEDLDMENFQQGFLAALKGQRPEIDEARLQAAMESLGEMLQTREKLNAEANLAAGKKFLEENAKRDGVITTESGLQYEIIEKGGAEKYTAPAEGEEDQKQFLVNYRGTLIDGTEFDASPEGQPVPMTLQVIEGFREALTTMPVGAKWKLFIPSELAYGEERRSAEIAPNTVLIFELELVSIEDAPPQLQGLPFPLPEGQPGQ